MSGSSNKLENAELETNSELESTIPKQTTSPSLCSGSTGPRTSRGKEKSKRNAIKHGIFSEVAVLGHESQLEFDAFVSGLRDAFQPVGTAEETLVEILAVTWWRLRRALVAEAAEIEMGEGFLICDQRERHRIEADQVKLVSYRQGLIKKIANPEIAKDCISRLRALKTLIETRGFDPDNDKDKLDKIYGELEFDYRPTDPHYFYRYLLAITQLPEDKKKGSPSYDECKTSFVKVLDEEILRILAYTIGRELIEESRMRVEMLRRNVPDAARLDQLMRYSASVERTLDRTLSQLQRLQAMRRGQLVLAPIKVDISAS